jgi:hypothetical protein
VFTKALDEKKIRRIIEEDNFSLNDRFHTKMTTQKRSGEAIYCHEKEATGAI